jgi:hypothetical protein
MSATFGVGQVLGTSFRVWRRNLVPFLAITALFYAPPWIWLVARTHAEYTPENLRAVVNSLTTALELTFALNLLVSAMLIYGAVMELRGQRASFGACIATGLRRFPVRRRC